MGCMSSSSSQSTAVDRTDTTTLPKATADELALRAQFGHLSDQQFNVLRDEIARISGPGFSPLSLSPQDQEEVNKAFSASKARFALESKDYADTLAGGRGLRMSDTPIAQQALERQGLGLADIESQQANAGLGYSLQSNDYRTRSALGLAAGAPAAGAFNLSQYLQERMAQPSVRSLGYGSGSGTMTGSGISNAAQLASGVGALGLGAAAAYGAAGLGSAGAGVGLSTALGGSILGATAI